MDLKAYFLPLLRWWWMVLIAVALAVGTAFFVTASLPPIYLARTTLLIGRAILDPNPNANELSLSQQLAGIYIAIAERETVQAAARAVLGLDQLPDYEVRSLANGQFIEIAVTDVDPLRAQVVANELAHQLILQSPSNSQAENEARDAFVAAQLAELQARIEATQREIAELQTRLGDIESASELVETQDAIAALETRLTLLQSNYASLLSSSGQGALNSLTVIEPAVLPTVPIGPNRPVLIGLAAVGALTLAIAAVYLLDYFDDTFSTSERVLQVLQLPIIGRAVELSRRERRLNPVSPGLGGLADDMFRSLRTNLEFAGLGAGLKTILVTSPGVRDGKTTVAAHLAAVIAESGRRVILVDADLRNPELHKRLEIGPAPGLQAVLTGTIDLEAALLPVPGAAISILPAGQATARSTELLASETMDRILCGLEALADVIVVDSPPFLIADAWILAAKVQGVVMVIRLGHTAVRSAAEMKHQLELGGARVLGVVLNRLSVPSSYPYHHLAYPPPASGLAPDVLDPATLPHQLRGRAPVPPTKSNKPAR